MGPLGCGSSQVRPQSRERVMNTRPSWVRSEQTSSPSGICATAGSIAPRIGRSMRPPCCVQVWPSSSLT